MSKSKKLSLLLISAVATVGLATATLTACGNNNHSHTLEKQNGQSVTCATDGWKDYYKCSDCDELYEDAEGTIEITDLEAWKTGDGKLLATGQHTQGELKTDGVTEWYECTGCGTKFDEVTHTHRGGEATCEDKATCSVCGHEYGELGAHTVEKVNGQAATCDVDGWKDYYECTVCHTLYADAEAAVIINDLEAWKVGDGKMAAGHVFNNGTCSGCGVSESVYTSLGENGSATLLTANGDYIQNTDKRLDEINGSAIGGVLNWNGISWTDSYYTPDNEAEILAGSKDGNVLKTGLVVWGYTKLPYVSFNNVVKASDVEQISFRIYAHLSETSGYGGYNGTNFADPSTKGIFLYGNNAQAGKAEGGVMIDPYVQQDAWIDYVIKGADIAKLADENGNISGFYFGSLICGGIYNTTDGANPATAQALIYIDGVTVSTHAMEKVSGQAATCVENGWKGYYHCSDCDKNYADEAGKVEITDLDAWKAGDGKIPATNVHTLEKVDGQAAACTIDGWKDYYKCSICGALYEDAEGTKTIADLDAWKVGDGKIASVGAHGKGDLKSDGVTEWYECTECGVKFDEVAHSHRGGEATCQDKAECSVCGQEYGDLAAHTLAIVNGQAKTCYEDGWKDYYECSVCGELYEDEEGATAITDLEAWKVGDGKIACTGHSFVEGTCSECGVTETATKELAEKGITTLLTVNGDYTANSDKRLSEINGSAIGGVLNWNGLSWNTDAYTPDNEAEILAGSRDGNVLKTGLVVWGYTKLPYVSFNNVVKASDVEQISFRIYAHLSDTPGYGGYNGTNFAEPSTKGIFLYGNNAQAGKADGGIMIDPYVQQDAWINYVITGEDVAKLADENGNISGFYFGSLICGGIYNTTDGGNPATAQALIYIDGVTVSKGNVVEKIGGKAATCTEEGWSDYYYNPVTDKYYSDEACTNEITDLAAWKVDEGKLDATGHIYVDGTCSGCGITETATKELEENGRTELLTANGDYSDAGNRLSKIEGAGSASGMTWGGAGSFATIQWNNTYTLENEAEILAGSKDGKVLKTGIFSFGQTQLPYISFSNVVKASEVDSITFRIYAHLSSGSTYGNGGLIYFYGNNANAGKAGGGVILNSDITQNAWVDFVITGADIAKLADENGNISGFYLGSHILVDNPNYLYISTVGTDSTSAPAILFIDSVMVSKNVVQKVSGKAATCTEEGWSDYYYNPGTDKNYSDAECTNEITDLEAWKVGDGKLALAGHTYVDGTCSGCGVTETATKALEENGTATLLTANGDYTNEEAKCLSKVEGQASGGLTWATSGGGINAVVKWNNTYTLANEGDILAGSSDGNVLKTGILVYGQTRLSYIRFNQVVKASEVDKITFRIYAHLSSGSTYGNGGLIYFYGDNANAGKAGGGVALKNDVTQDAWIDYEITGADIAKLADANGNISGFYLCSYIMVGSEAHLYNSTSGTDATSAHALLFIDSVSVSKSAE